MLLITVLREMDMIELDGTAVTTNQKPDSLKLEFAQTLIEILQDYVSLKIKEAGTN